jgi:hypothetical protein
MNTIPTIDQVNSLNCRLFATLHEDEAQVLDFYMKQGRKFDVTVELEKRLLAAELSAAPSAQHAEEMLKKAETLVRVQVSEGAEAAWAERSKPSLN